MRRTTVFLDDLLIKRLKQRARAERRSVAAVVREALTAYLAPQRSSGARIPSVAGAFESSFTDTTERAEELLGQLRRDPHDDRPG